LELLESRLRIAAGFRFSKGSAMPKIADVIEG